MEKRREALARLKSAADAAEERYRQAEARLGAVRAYYPNAPTIAQLEADVQRASRDAEAAYGSYAEYKYGTQ